MSLTVDINNKLFIIYLCIKDLGDMKKNSEKYLFVCT